MAGGKPFASYQLRESSEQDSAIPFGDCVWMALVLPVPKPLIWKGRVLANQLRVNREVSSNENAPIGPGRSC
jgi:hypothetical protein